MQCSQLPTALRLCLLSSNLASLMSSRFILLCVLTLMFGLVVGLWSCSQSALRTTVLCDVTAVCCVSCLHHYASGGTTPPLHSCTRSKACYRQNLDCWLRILDLSMMKSSKRINETNVGFLFLLRTIVRYSRFHCEACTSLYEAFDSHFVKRLLCDQV